MMQPSLLLQRLAYQLVLGVVSPFIPVRLFVRGFKERGYWRHWGERLGGSPLRIRHAVWIHAVSVGEARAAAPLVDGLLAAHPAVPLLVTCMTPAGRATLQQLFGERAEVRYLPYDFRFAMRRFLRHTQPRLGLVMETELWPNLVREAARADLPLVLVNARLSARSARGYAKASALTRATLGGFRTVAAQTAADAERLRALGAQQLVVTGNLKFDCTPPLEQQRLGDAFRSRIGARPVWLLASARPGEEAAALEAFKVAPADIVLIIVPRHPQRFDEVASLIARHGLRYQRRSDNAGVDASTRVWLGDSLGEMFAYYRAADSALIGGSLLPYGGQNLIEACAVGCPVVLGPHTENFRQAAADAIEAGAAVRVGTACDWVQQATRLTADQAARQQMRDAGLRFAERHKGASARVLAELSRVAGI